MSEHTPGFYEIQLYRLRRDQAILRAALVHTQEEDVLAEYNANFLDLLGTTVRHHLGTDDKINAAHDMAHEYIKMPRIKRWLFDIKSHHR